MAAKFCGNTTQLMNWCQHNGYQLPSISHGVTHHMPTLPSLTLTSWVIVGAAAYMVGRVGLPAAWTDLKNIYSWIRSKFSGSTTAPAPAATTTA